MMKAERLLPSSQKARTDISEAARRVPMEMSSKVENPAQSAHILVT